jgi:hypothetical protein
VGHDTRRRGVARNEGEVGTAACVRLTPQVPSKPGAVLPDDASYSSGRDGLSRSLGGGLELSHDGSEDLLLTTALRAAGREVCRAGTARRRHVALLVGRRMVRGEVSAAPAMAAMAGVVGVVGCMPERPYRRRAVCVMQATAQSCRRGTRAGGTALIASAKSQVWVIGDAMAGAPRGAGNFYHFNKRLQLTALLPFYTKSRSLLPYPHPMARLYPQNDMRSQARGAPTQASDTPGRVATLATATNAGAVCPAHREIQHDTRRWRMCA